ncbi:MAG TPA: anthranilate synthase component I family protein [Pyrinomonadaceae bacterium]|jgi:anthranilate synthase component 1|nr:anthranilate synthase component I family protein [Pyrinomonadaceae bacterium]
MLDLTPGSYEDFVKEAGQGNVVPVVRTVLADLQTPVGAYLRLAGASPYAFLLESVEGGERIARYSFLGTDPEMIVRGHGPVTFIERQGKREIRSVKAVDFVREYFRDRILARRSGLAPFAGGAVGYLSYDAAKWFEPSLEKEEALNPSETQPLELPTDAFWMFYRNVIAFDRVRQQMEIIAIVFTAEAEGSKDRLRQLYEEAVTRTAAVEAELLKGAPAVTSAAQVTAPAIEQEELKSNWTRRGFEEGVRQIKEHISAGDCYQVVLSQRFSKPYSGDPISIYRALRSINPSPYMFFLRCGADTVIGASPEMLVRCHGQRLDYRPIAGTRKRGSTETEDWILGEDLKTDEKEVAEHMMLVDLGRNDLGRVADFGSVKVEDLMSVERYSHVQHLVTSLRARLRDGLDRFDALGACFPAGTVTGAPKIKAMEIIKKLEPERRGIYAGSVLYLDYADNLDSCIAIRTIELRKGEASVQAGAGIVADSVPEHEFAETVNKARAMFRAIELAERGL